MCKNFQINVSNDVDQQKTYGTTVKTVKGDDSMLRLRLCRPNDFKYRGFSDVENKFVSGNIMRFPETYLSVAIEGFLKKRNGEEILTYRMVWSNSVEKCIGKDALGNEIYKKVSEEELWQK